jgi:uncharacterized protein
VRRPVQNQTDVQRLRTRLGWGEAEAIVLTREIRADAVVLDDATARHIAEQEGCRVIGLLGLLIEGKQRDLLGAVKPLLDAMRNSGFFIGDDLYTAVLHQAAEK